MSDLDQIVQSYRPLPALEHKEMVALVVRAQSGDDQARDEVVRRTIRYVVGHALRVSHRLASPVEVGDLVQSGAIGILEAIEKFDPEVGATFVSYATWWIYKNTGEWLERDLRPVRVPKGGPAAIGRLRRARRELGPNASTEQVAAAADVDPDIARDLLVADVPPDRLDAPIGDEGAPLHDLLPSDATASGAADSAIRSEAVGQAIDELLPERSAHIVRARFGIERARRHTLGEIGDEVGLSRERVRQILNDSLCILEEDGLLRAIHGGVA